MSHFTNVWLRSSTHETYMIFFFNLPSAGGPKGLNATRAKVYSIHSKVIYGSNCCTSCWKIKSATSIKVMQVSRNTMKVSHKIKKSLKLKFTIKIKMSCSARTGRSNENKNVRFKKTSDLSSSKCSITFTHLTLSLLFKLIYSCGKAFNEIPKISTLCLNP